MTSTGGSWFATRTSSSEDWPTDDLIAAKTRAGLRVSVVMPAKDEQDTVGDVVATIRRELVVERSLVDEVVVMDSLSADSTAEVARAAGATVWSVADVRPDLGVRTGKGEALWKSLFVTTGDILVFIDADLTEWGPHFVTGLVGPLLAERETLLVKGFYDRLLDASSTVLRAEGGRVTELMARPLLATWWPELSRVVQPLAGEWAVRREWFASLHVPCGYGVELACLLDTYASRGLAAVAQVDLGRRAHRHQSLHDLAAMALEILAVADSRHSLPRWNRPECIPLAQPDRGDPEGWRIRSISVSERPPAALLGARS